MGWGAWERGCRLGVSLTEWGGATSRTVRAEILFESQVHVTDSTNTLSWGGAQSGSKSPGMAWSRSGQAVIHTLQWDVATSYGVAQPVSLSAWLTAIEYIPDGRLDASGDVTIPARPYELPNRPPAGWVTRVSDWQHTVSWTTDFTGASEARPWNGVEVERWDNVSGVYSRIATVSWDVTSYADTSTVPDRVYSYRLRSYNPSGHSAYTDTTPAMCYTTPAAHANLTWLKDGADVVLTWSRMTTIAAPTEVEESTDGGSTWVWLSTVAAGLTQWRHTSPPTNVTHRYRVRPLAPAKWTVSSAGAWTYSTVVQLLSPPLAPTSLAPASLTVDSGADAVTLSWQHNTVDGTTQLAYELRYQIGAAGWSTITGATTSNHVFPAGTWPRGVSVEWQVRTRGQHATFSPWSTSAVFHTGTRPIATIQTPAAGAVIGTPTMPISWTFFDAEGMAQGGAEVEVIQAGSVIWSRSVSGAGTEVVPPQVPNGVTLTVRVRVLDGSGLWSLWTSTTVPVEFVPPPVPTGVVVWDDDAGAAMITVTNPQVTGDQVDAEHNQVWRSLDDGVTWTLAADHVPLGATVSDRAALANGRSLYRIRSVSATPTIADSAPIVLVSRSCWAWVSGGPGLGTVARVRAEAQVAATRGRPKKLHRFVGDAYPTEFASPAGRDASWTLSGKVAARAGDLARVAQWGTWQPWDDIANLPAPLLFRDPLGRRAWVSISDVQVSHQPGDAFAAISCTLTQVSGHD